MQLVYLHMVSKDLMASKNYLITFFGCQQNCSQTLNLNVAKEISR